MGEKRRLKAVEAADVAYNNIGLWPTMSEGPYKMYDSLLYKWKYA
jgi:hypothetical protein